MSRHDETKLYVTARRRVVASFARKRNSIEQRLSTLCDLGFLLLCNLEHTSANLEDVLRQELDPPKPKGPPTVLIGVCTNTDCILAHEMLNGDMLKQEELCGVCGNVVVPLPPTKGRGI